MRKLVSIFLIMLMLLAPTLYAYASGGAVMIIPASASAPASAVPADATVLVTLAGTATGSSGILRVYTRADENESWELRFYTTAAYGSAGLYKEAEGDLRTPTGVFRMNTPFGIAAPMEGFPADYITINESHYWVGDMSSPLYNRLVSTDCYTDFDRSLSEHLIDYGGYYDYCLDIGYNPAGTPGAGSALFLHCTPDGAPTHGCVAIPEADMIKLLLLYEQDHTYMAIFDKSRAGR